MVNMSLDEWITLPCNNVSMCFSSVHSTVAEFRPVAKDTKSNTKNITNPISIHSDYQSVHFW